MMILLDPPALLTFFPLSLSGHSLIPAPATSHYYPFLITPGLQGDYGPARPIGKPLDMPEPLVAAAKGRRSASKRQKINHVGIFL